MAEFLQDNWVVLAVAAYAAASECMPFMNRVKSNGVLHFIYLFIGKLLRR
jgi:hypothetical protein